MAPQWFMAGQGAIPNFGPDNSLALLPMPYLLIYYGIFFFWGAFYYDADDADAKVGKQWVITMPIALLVIFPVTLILGLSPDSYQKYHLVSLILKAAYAWMLVFSLMGICHELITRESRVWRYISDVAYWLYLGHLPLISRGAGASANMEPAGAIQVWFGMSWSIRCFAPNPSIFPALYLPGHTAE